MKPTFSSEVKGENALSSGSLSPANKGPLCGLPGAPSPIPCFLLRISLFKTARSHRHTVLPGIPVYQEAGECVVEKTQVFASFLLA